MDKNLSPVGYVKIESCPSGKEYGSGIRVYNNAPQSVMLQVRNYRTRSDGTLSDSEYLIAGTWLSKDDAQKLIDMLQTAIKEM